MTFINHETILKRAFTIAFACLFIGCRKDDSCEVDELFIKKFRTCINSIQQSELQTRNVFIEEKVEAILFLNAVTGHESQVSNLHFAIYDSIDLLYQDLRIWQNWLEENKCLMTIARADSTLDRYNRGVP